MTEQRKAAINAAYDIAAEVAEGVPSAEALSLVAANLDDTRRIAAGKRTAEDISREFATETSRFWLNVEPDGALWSSQLAIAESVLQQIGDAELAAMLRRVRWADACDPPEPWEIDPASPDQNAAIPALRSPETDEQPDPGPGVPPLDPETSEALQDNTDSEGSPDAEVIDAEVVDVERVTSSQTTHKLPPGQFYSPSNRPSWARSLTKPRPSIEISTGSAHLGDQR